ncbi:aldose 1-epimerase [Marchantia polymorpha subsp. ruderalis]|uniref:Aldose 1-epimerase n=2 Tax=Marchantia polymorpha TaxID=3197 RepID=A0AAF6BKK9_MARPO|nr:hypothetical protein MARPO_0058s0080 [Marchantia polymorpha]BBN12543.1 hypothetical protein Mp_5g20990 [Marchantia polymorpha subsp. ruderalis]|eukprot:PTQ37301.1 hypothetical protein MARPO_0058s0080 [Marchantia polymorpha]
MASFGSAKEAVVVLALALIALSLSVSVEIGAAAAAARTPEVLLRSSSSSSSSVLESKMDEMYVSVDEVDMLKVYTLKRGKMEVKITDWGATVMSVKVPDARGQVADVVLGFDSPATYMDPNSTAYLGAIVGRVANRIGNASFKLNGRVYHLPANDGNNTLHGGLVGFDKVLWQSQQLDLGQGPSVQFYYNSFDGEQGFPGSLEVSVTYTLGENGEFKIEMEAKAGKKATPVNLASHTYWNLRGHDSGTILDHLLQIFASHYTPVNEKILPTGAIDPVQGTALDFLEQRPVGTRIDEVSVPTGGYDHNYVLGGVDHGDCDGLKRAIRVVDPMSGRVMEIFTSAPGMQFYTSNFLDCYGKGGAHYQPRNAYCFETQGFPNAVNEPKFPTVIVQPGEIYRHVMVHRFSTS